MKDASTMLNAFSNISEPLVVERNVLCPKYETQIFYQGLPDLQF